jgi:hypothetical protein
MAEVIHRYVADPEAKRGNARRGMVALRREQTAHEKAKRLQREMQIAVERGELIKKELVLQQASFLLVALRQRCMSAPSAFLEDLSNLPEKLSDPRWTGEGDATLAREVDRGNVKVATKLEGLGEPNKKNGSLLNADLICDSHPKKELQMADRHPRIPGTPG